MPKSWNPFSLWRQGLQTGVTRIAGLG